MSTFEYPEFQTLAAELFTEFGRSVTLYKIGHTPANPANPWRGPLDPRDTPVDSVTLPAVFLDTISSRYLGINIELADGEKGEQKLVLIATASAPGKDLRTFDELVDGLQRYSITALNILHPGDQEIFIAFKAAQRELMS